MFNILQADKSYTFSDYFNLNYSTKEIVAEFGYSFKLEKISLPKKQISNLDISKLRQAFYKKLPHISLNSEMAKREFFISPILLEMLDYIDFNIEVEYAINFNDKLRGSVDYFLTAKKNLLVIEAKNADLDKGFSQLAVELIAMDNIAPASDFLYGAVTLGDVWRFCCVDRVNKVISKDIDIFAVPSHLEALFLVFAGILAE
jgi:hypothetical protein